MALGIFSNVERQALRQMVVDLHIGVIVHPAATQRDMLITSVHAWMERIARFGNISFVEAERKTTIQAETNSVVCVRAYRRAGFVVVIRPNGNPEFYYRTPCNEGCLRLELSFANPDALLQILWELRQYYLSDAYLNCYHVQ
jgi:hypothetical protein